MNRLQNVCLSSLVFLMLPLVACGDAHGHGDTGQILELMDTADVERGYSYFMNSCGVSSCHGPTGSGLGSDAPDLALEVPEHDDLALAGILRNGEDEMPGMVDRFDDQALADIFVYLRASYPEE